jgi:flagellar export protein FliJ
MERRIKLLGLLERWKELEEESLRQKLLQVQAELKEIFQQKKALEIELNEILKELETQKSITAQELIAKLSAKEQVKTLIKNTQQIETKKKRELESIRKNLEAVNKKKRVYETLKDKLFTLYQEEKAKALLKELDDLAIMRKAREPKNED